jgi:hypothetical protein
MPTYPTVDESHGRLRRAGGSFGHTGTAGRWQVTGSNGENRIGATGGTLAAAYWRACVLAREVGLLAPPRGEPGGRP